jgi:hypothetical protein
MVDTPPLTDQQTAVLQAIYDYFREHGTWPTFITIDRQMRRQYGWDTAVIVLGVPEHLLVSPRPGHLPPIESDTLRLRLAGLEVCNGTSDDADHFVRTLRWLAQREEDFDPPPGSEMTMPRTTSSEIEQHLGLGDDAELPLRRLYELLRIDGWGVGSFQSGDLGWSVTPTRDIWRFNNVQTVADCIAARDTWKAESRPHMSQQELEENLMDAEFLYGSNTSGPVSRAPASAASPPYVDEKIVEAIRAKDGQGKFDVTKLLRLIHELNDNYARGNTYASHALLRGLLDHIPPILGCKNFEEVANNYRWPQTDKKYMKWLANFRAQGDDALHRQISTKADLLGFDDMPASVCVDHLLQECADQL